ASILHPQHLDVRLPAGADADGLGEPAERLGGGVRREEPAVPPPAPVAVEDEPEAVVAGWEVAEGEGAPRIGDGREGRAAVLGVRLDPHRTLGLDAADDAAEGVGAGAGVAARVQRVRSLSLDAERARRA